MTVSPAAMPSIATKMSFTLRRVEKLSFSGLRASVPLAFIAWKTGLSLSFSRIHSEMARSSSEKRNGMRHPHSAHCASVTSSFDPSTTMRLRSEEHTSELQSLMRISYAVFCLKKKKKRSKTHTKNNKDKQV